MKRNFLIIFLLAVIVFFTYKIFNSAVVTQRKVEPSQVSTEVIENSELNKIPPKADDNAKSPLNPEFRFTSDYNNTNSKKDFIQDKKEHFSEQSFEFEKQKADNIYSKSNKSLTFTPRWFAIKSNLSTVILILPFSSLEI